MLISVCKDPITSFFNKHSIFYTTRTFFWKDHLWLNRHDRSLIDGIIMIGSNIRILSEFNADAMSRNLTL